MQIEYIIRHIQADTDCSNTAKCMLQLAQLYAGTSTSILEETTPLTYLEGIYVNNLRAGLTCINGTIRLPSLPITLPQRKHNKHIVDILQHEHSILNNHLKVINYCRFFLKVELISDIATTGRLKIHPHFLQHKPKLLNNQLYTTKWSRQQQITMVMWQIWTTALTQIICTTHGKLQQPLGEWINRTRQLTHYYDTKLQTAYIITNNTWQVHTHRMKNRKMLEFY
eukprot:1501995-Ditylum_brightwellii.AAC.1